MMYCQGAFAKPVGNAVAHCVVPVKHELGVGLAEVANRWVLRARTWCRTYGSCQSLGAASRADQRLQVHADDFHRSAGNGLQLLLSMPGHTHGPVCER
eukprot:5630168-Alexandrium_andersonii.AAC.1